ncbi:uncharacterized protein METZ01_LOCUS501770, partial [marine metagenome]
PRTGLGARKRPVQRRVEPRPLASPMQLQIDCETMNIPDFGPPERAYDPT